MTMHVHHFGRLLANLTMRADGVLAQLANIAQQEDQAPRLGWACADRAAAPALPACSAELASKLSSTSMQLLTPCQKVEPAGKGCKVLMACSPSATEDAIGVASSQSRQHAIERMRAQERDP